jgi:AcrR family transcriptional regulator
MPARQKLPIAASTHVWERPEPARRRAPVPLTRQRIVQAAIGIADDEGLAAVSLRKVAAKLKAMPMRLYTYTSTKDGLLELMVDVVYGEIAAADHGRGEWRRALGTIAQRTRRASRKHPWFVDLFGGRPHQGPNALAYLEACFAALDGVPGFADIDVAMQAVKTVNAFVIGAVQSEMSERRAQTESGLTKKQWQAASAGYMARALATGRYPMLARVVRDATHPSPDVVFEEGLECVLDGIAARIARR